MSVAELMPTLISLPHAEKFQLMQWLLTQLASEEGIQLNTTPVSEPFNPRLFFGAANASQQEIDAYLMTLHEGWL